MSQRICASCGHDWPRPGSLAGSASCSWCGCTTSTQAVAKLVNQTTPSKAALRKAVVNALNYSKAPDHVEEILDLITTTLTQQRDEVLAQLPEKRSEEYKSWVDGMMDKPSSYKNNGMTVQEAKGYNAAIDQVTAIIKRAGITGSGE